ncbi:response regulator transcription factor [Paenibacillus radicis (ex Xue et al. 2023)]|uniref:Response regulator n=1 Tax=Paenibacillus radicis (ex Xue et al. 2023) TaxID=2972489 RepID=A0ABT1YKW2_9BACL|nr:response regulator [Paenibacillus radicis (ex Xue et al. 2023)]MCR8633828.1 response regulator [Paenibacillus radicis (ex Xue et al. 2023)]
MYQVLLVDDERWVRTSLKRVLEKTELPFSVTKEASNGLEALDWLEDNKADLILTDVRMPVMEGLAFVQEVRKQDSGQQVILVSGYDDFQYVQQALRLGVIDYLLKPVEIEDMKRCLVKWMEHKQGQQLERSMANNKATNDDRLHKSPIEQVKEYIQAHLAGEITLTEAAARVHLNPSYLSQLFKQQLNRNFVDYIVEVRMEAAKRLLCCTSLRINEVADRVGYADVAYFSNTFKKWNSCTPSEFRKEQARTGTAQQEFK